MPRNCIKCGQGFRSEQPWYYLRGAVSGTPEDEDKIFIDLASFSVICSTCYSLEQHKSIWGEIKGKGNFS